LRKKGKDRKRQIKIEMILKDRQIKKEGKRLRKREKNRDR
jgi:hypothetical protein